MKPSRCCCCENSFWHIALTLFPLIFQLKSISSPSSSSCILFFWSTSFWIESVWSLNTILFLNLLEMNMGCDKSCAFQIHHLSYECEFLPILSFSHQFLFDINGVCLQCAWLHHWEKDRLGKMTRLKLFGFEREFPCWGKIPKTELNRTANQFWFCHLLLSVP